MIFTAHLRLRQIGLMTALMITLSACTAYHGSSAYLPSKNGIEAGDSITVKGDENIYTIAHEHNVSMRELIVLNDLKPPFEVRPGQSIILPATGASFAGDLKAPSPAPLAPVEKNDLAPIEPAGVSSQPLQPLAPAAPPAQPQTKFVVPQAMTSPQPLVAAQPPAAAPAVEPVQALNRPSPQQKQVATTMAPAATEAAAASAGAIDMVWPIQGPILSSFGSKGAGLTNDGINIGAPKGAPVVAAAPGTVVYAGNEMKGFGNLVLIRHGGDWVTAYAHLDRVMVKKDSVVGQGDMIGTVGKTGNAPTPQLHFETRLAGKPVDPAGVIKGTL